MREVNLFCLPFAGGSKYSYRLFEQYVPSFLKLVCLEYPGRGSRSNEALSSDAGVLVMDLYKQIIEGAGFQKPYALFGHSMGGLMAYLLLQKIRENKQLLPGHVFITSTTGPSSPSRKEHERHNLDKDAFITEIRKLKGCPDDILDNKELLNYIEPILRADFKLSETFIYQKADPVQIPFTVITGCEEEFELSDIHLWQQETMLPIDFKQLPGNHFFIYQFPYRIVEIITKKLFENSTKKFSYE